MSRADTLAEVARVPQGYEERTAAMVRGYDAGLGVPEIARAAGLGHDTVRKIVYGALAWREKH